jgi:hypothetical protein
MLNSGSKADSSVYERCDKALREKSPAGDMEQPKMSADEDGRSITEAGRSTSDLGIGEAYFSPC